MVRWHSGTIRQDSGAWVRVVLPAEVTVLSVRPGDLLSLVDPATPKEEKLVPVAIVRPKPVYGPAILGKQLAFELQSRVSIPELRLQN